MSPAQGLNEARAALDALLGIVADMIRTGRTAVRDRDAFADGGESMMYDFLEHGAKALDCIRCTRADLDTIDEELVEPRRRSKGGRRAA